MGGKYAPERDFKGKPTTMNQAKLRHLAFIILIIVIVLGVRIQASWSLTSDIIPQKDSDVSGTFLPVFANLPPTNVLVSIDSNGVIGNSWSFNPTLSANGRFVAFESQATNLVNDDTNDSVDIFVHDLYTRETLRVSVASDGTEADGTSEDPSISGDGRLVVFTSWADNLVNNDTNGLRDVFIHDQQTGETRLISITSAGVSDNNSISISPHISADGRFVTFASSSNNLVIGDTNVHSDIFVHDLQTGETTLVSVATNGIQSNDRSSNPTISADGRFVAFTSYATNLVIGDLNNMPDVFLHDRNTGTTTIISVTSDGTQGDYASYGPAAISADGRFVAFLSFATNLVIDDTNSDSDIFVHDLQTGNTTIESVSSDGVQGSAASYPTISADGRFIAFGSKSANLVMNDINEYNDIFVRDRQEQETVIVSLTNEGSQTNSYSVDPFISADGRFVAFYSNDNLIDGDNEVYYGVYVHFLGSK